jgi:hypothetical protein
MDAQQKASVVRDVAAQVEWLLYLAYHLQLEPLQEVLHGFTRNNSGFNNSPLYGHMGAVLSPRVLQAHAGTDLAKQGLLQQLVGQAYILGPTPEGLLVPAGAAESGVLEFKAALAKPLPGTKFPAYLPHYLNVVDMKLDMYRGALIVAERAYTVQLLVGPPLCNASQRQAVLCEPKTAQPPVPLAPAE